MTVLDEKKLKKIQLKFGKKLNFKDLPFSRLHEKNFGRIVMRLNCSNDQEKKIKLKHRK